MIDNYSAIAVQNYFTSRDTAHFDRLRRVFTNFQLLWWLSIFISFTFAYGYEPEFNNWTSNNRLLLGCHTVKSYSLELEDETRIAPITICTQTSHFAVARDLPVETRSRTSYKPVAQILISVNLLSPFHRQRYTRSHCYAVFGHLQIAYRMQSAYDLTPAPKPNDSDSSIGVSNRENTSRWFEQNNEHAGACGDEDEDTYASMRWCASPSGCIGLEGADGPIVMPCYVL